MDEILLIIKNSSIEILNKIRYMNIFDLSSNNNKTNISGDNIKKLDQLSNDIISNNLLKNKNVAGIISEEENNLIKSDYLDGKYIVSFDPLDGSSNIDSNITIGTIFCIFNHKKYNIKNGKDIVMAGYILYGGATQLVVTENKHLNIYLLNKDNNYQIIANNYKIPNISNFFSANLSNQNKWLNNKINLFIDYLIANNKNLRYVGSLVADAHRTLIKGGCFLYPNDTKNKNGKLRLVYEGYPIAYIFKCAGGYAINEITNILDIPFPQNIHQTTSLLLFNSDDYKSYSLKTKILNINHNIMNVGIVLAGGLGKRMKSEIPKVLHTINNKSMLSITIEKLFYLNLDKIYVVVGKYKNLIISKLTSEIGIKIKLLEFVTQQETLGTGHAVKCCLDHLDNFREHKALILFGDAPCIKTHTLEKMINNNNECNLAICNLSDPSGCGRIILNNEGNIVGSIEQKDCNQEQLKIKISNTGIYHIKVKYLFDYLHLIKNNNAQQEYYLPDILYHLLNDNINVVPFYIKDENEIVNVNNIDQLKKAKNILE